ncbi:hypothetical protein [Novosphingobium album (ex Hu et al. 2023)]|uniref:Uncharacterized protein n=1 Tax=Novosphingobium album (ex Hu et al. 2023) TaxID=2930093 RepID=A0ABT0AWG5_9SPHN|nr:hypothetical protein [Novosphingobium album (ex Hu et al. 2023)]MCJ2177110.1 hypothetical protein [Novosphingobium album (ex Hu et al. 2023)]
MRQLLLTAGTAAALLASPVFAEQQAKPVTDRDPDVEDVAKTPIDDLNVGRDGEIPPLLIAAVADPYALKGLGKCRQLSTAITDLDAVLGPDIDLPKEERDRISSGRVAKWLVSSFIPFRGLIREISGANDQDRKVSAAIQAGVARRGFLKGVGEARGCKYPARPAPPSIAEAHRDALQASDGKDSKPDKKTKGSDTKFTSEPVVQSVP